MSAVSQGDIAVVVGASGGIGRALVAALCDDARYEHVVGLSRRRPSDFADDGRRSWIQADILDAPSDAAVISRVRDAVTAQCRQYPVYG